LAGIDYGWITPELAKNPGVAAGVATSPDPGTSSVLASQSLNGVTAKDVVADHMANNESASFWTRTGINVFGALNFLAKPLQEVQRDYRFIHSVTQKHGVLAGFLSSIGTVAGGVAGSVLGPEGTMIGAELGSTLSRKLLGNYYKDSYADSENPNYKVSAGRDFSNALAGISDAVGADGTAANLRNTNSGIGKFVSGITDATFDVTTDPINVASKFNSLMKNGKYLKMSEGAIDTQVKNPLMKALPGMKDFLDSHSGRVFTPQQLDLVKEGTLTNATSRTYNRALDDMANINNTAKTAAEAAGNIALKYPELGATAAARISKLKSADEIHNALRDSVYFDAEGGNLAGSAILPSRTLLRAKGLEPIQKALRGDATPAEMNWVRKGYKTFSGYMPYSVDPTTLELSTKSFKWNSPDATSVIYRIARFGMGHGAASEMAGQYAQAVASGDIGLAKAIKAHTVFDSFKAMGLPDENMLVMNAKHELDNLDKPHLDQQVYFADPAGNPGGVYETIDGRTAVAGVSEHQFADEFSIPDFNLAKQMLRDAGKYTKYYGKLDSFTAKAYTNSIFKPLALATLGFGLRVSASEMIPAVARYGFTNMFKAKLAVSAAKANRDLVEGEGKHVASAALVSLGAAKGIAADALTGGYPAFKQAFAKGLAKVAPEDQLQYAIDLQLHNDGHFVSPGASTGNSGTASMRYDMQNAAHIFFQQEKRKLAHRETGDFTTYQADSSHYLPMYATSLGKEAKIAKGRNIASDIADVFGGQTANMAEEVKRINPNMENISGVANVETSFLKKFQEFDRTSSAENLGPESLNTISKIQKDLQAGKGFTDPLVLEYWVDKDGKLSLNLAEGNHRLAAAEAAGIDNVPVKIVKGYADDVAKGKPAGKSPILPDRTGYLPGNPKPENLLNESVLAKTTKQKIDKVTLEKEVGSNAYDKYQAMRQELINREYKRIMDTKAGTYKDYKRESELGARWANQDPHQFAADRVDSILGLTIGKDGTVHLPIAENIAAGKPADLQYLKDTDVRKLPAAIPGQQIETYIPAGKSFQTLMNHVIDLGFNKLIDPVINGLSREPLYLVHFSNEMESLKYLVNTDKMSYDQAVRVAQYRATHAMLPQIHNVALRTQFSQLARNFMPFYFAQEQAVKRAMRVAKDTGVGSPIFSRAVRLYQMSEQVMNNPAFIEKDANGNSYAYLPFVGEWGKNLQSALNAFGVPMVSGLPISAQGSLTSLKSVIPGLELPGVSPIVAIPANAVASWFPSLAPAINTPLGLAANRGVWESFMPSKPVMNVWNALGPDQQNSALTNALMSALAAAEYHNQVPTAQSSLQERQAFIDRIRNNAKSILIIKSITGMLSPLSPRIEQADIGLRDEFVKLVKDTGNYNDALLKFLGEHGDSAISYTVAHTTPSVRGARFPYTEKAIGWIDQNLKSGGLLTNPQTSTGAMFLVPQDAGPGNTLAIHQQLINEHLRESRTPIEFLNQFYISDGNNKIAPYLAQHTANVNALKQAQSSYLLQQENQNWKAIVDGMKALNPTWYENYTSGAGRDNAAVALRQLQTIFADDKLTPKTEQAKLVKGLLSDYQSHMNIINQYKQLNITGSVVDMETQNWNTYLENLKTSDPRLESVINTVFSKVG